MKVVGDYSSGAVNALQSRKPCAVHENSPKGDENEKVKRVTLASHFHSKNHVPISHLVSCSHVAVCVDGSGPNLSFEFMLTP